MKNEATKKISEFLDGLKYRSAQLSSIAYRTGLSESTVRRALASMRKAGAVWPTASYCCGHRVVSWRLIA